MILMGALISWALFLATPVAIEWGIAESTMKSLPVYGFFIGAALGLGMALSPAVKQVSLSALGFLTLGAILWLFCVLFVGGALIFLGVPADNVDTIMDWLAPAAFAIGIVLGGIVALAVIHDKLDTLLVRLKIRRTHTPSG
jgi:hypothetical protein